MTENKINGAYDSPYWWYDIRGYFILRLAYQVRLFSLVKFFTKNFGENHLEVAIGSGTFLNICLKYAKLKKKELPKTVYGFDYADAMLAGARKTFKSHENIILIKSDVLSLPYEDKSFDTINIANSIHCFSDIHASLIELRRVLKDEGRISINVLLYAKGESFFARLSNKIDAWGMRKGILHTPYDIKSIKLIFKEAGFDIIDGYIKGNTYNVKIKRSTVKNSDVINEIQVIKPSESNTSFDYQTAFKRNIGWLKQSDIKLIKSCRIAIAGLGGVGGIHLLTLSRLGFEKFNIADFDLFELTNFNRQVGASMSTIGKKKTDVMRDMLLEINPNTQINIFNTAITQDNIDAFLDDCDIYIDSVDIFSLDLRIHLFERCRQLGIPAITAAPIGMGVSYLIFAPSEYTFTDYFNFFTNSTFEDKFINFLIGLNPTLCSSRYLMEPSAVNIKTHDTTSLSIGCNFAAGIAATETLKLVLSRGKTYFAPHYHVFDGYLHKHKIGRLYFGNRNLLQKIKFYLLKQRLFSRNK